ncbi:putative methyltransferase NSUN7 [Clytia hemisphaerica]|uniref:SAM-dependent MTase RsmB/NOP-type domain-containing protein n=1 Tax=Clytia hemisphaerica TaxID=252671 RepID=A0A7M5V3F0_9CNID
MATKSSKARDPNIKLLLTPEAERKKLESRKGSSRKERRRPSLTDHNRNKREGEILDDNSKRPISREERAQIKFGHTIYNKAANLFELLKDNTVVQPKIEFENEFEKRRAYSLAFAAKRFEGILKDVLLDSTFYSSYFKLETYHHSKVMVMLLDFYDHGFRFSESVRKKIEIDSKNHLDHIHDIQKAFFQHKVKLCSAFARNRIKACALSLDAMLPAEVKERNEHGSRHSLFTWINPFVADAHCIINQLKSDGFVYKESLEELSGSEDNGLYFSYEEDGANTDLLEFPAWCKDEVYNHQLALDSSLVPMSKPRYLMTKACRRAHDEVCRVQQKSHHHAVLPATDGKENHDMVNGGCDVVLTHPETGSLAAYLCSFLGTNKRLFIFGCHGDKAVEVEKNLKNIGISNYVLLSEDFKNIVGIDDRLSSVKLIVCNPPCSNSGVVNMVDFIIQEGADTASSLSKEATPVKIRGLAEEQASTIRITFSFPNVQSIVYCSFSTFPEENEKLVQRVLQSQQNSKNRFEMCVVLEDMRDIFTSSQDGDFLRVEPSYKMDGFFVTLLKRKIKEDSVSEVMERAAKKGLLKKSSGKKEKRKGVPKDQPPHVANRLSVVDKKKAGRSSPKPQKKLERRDTDEDGRFKF